MFRVRLNSRAVGWLAALSAVIASTPLPSAAQTRTDLLVRAVAQDAKIIGSGVGGAHITVRNAATGAVLAEGVQEGATGSTRAIIQNPRVRGETVFDTEGAGQFLATLSLDRPTLVEVEARGPLGTPHAEQRATKTLLMVPGEHVVGDGLVLTLHGFTVELLATLAGRPSEGDGATLQVRVRVTMLCGCPIEPGGTWDADRIEVVARLLQEDRVSAEGALVFAGQTSEFEGVLSAPGSGAYRLQVIASDPGRANTGMLDTGVTIPGR